MTQPEDASDNLEGEVDTDGPGDNSTQFETNELESQSAQGSNYE